MKFTCDKAALSEALAVVSKAVSAKSSIPALEGILLSAGDNLNLTGYNLEIGIQTTIEASVIKRGDIILNARLLGDIVRKLPDEMISFESDETLLMTIKCGRTEFNIIGISSNDFPEMPQVFSVDYLEISQKTLKSMISQTIFAISTNENKPIHTGSLFDIKEGFLNVVSVDGYRLALRKEPIENGTYKTDFSFVVPGNSLREVERILSDVDDAVSISIDKKHITFKIGDTTLTSRLLEGEFLNYQNAIPKAKAFDVVANVKELTNAVDRVSLIINERLKSPVRCNFEGDVLKITCVTSMGKAYDECQLEGNAGPLEIGFNNRYLLDALHACPDDKVIMELNTYLSPCIIRPIEGDSYVYLILPVRLKAAE